jgi:hypothetical protein
MIPASFAKTILKLILPNVTEHLMKVFKLDKVLSYVEKPNELDIKVTELEIKLQALTDIVKDIDAK